MSRYKQFEIDQLKDYPLETRPSLVNFRAFASALERDSFSAFIDSLPKILAADQLRLLAQAIKNARDRHKPIIWAFGGHVIKVGLGPVLIQLLEDGFVSAFATNGAGMIHDFEIALAGHTSEDVEKDIQNGSFGMARETGELLNRAIREGTASEKGIGESVGSFLDGYPGVAHPELSVVLQAHRRGVPLTVHIAIGTDTIHNHPMASGEALGKGSLIDFRILTQVVCDLGDGGVFLNLGSAVVIPEVFLKTVALVRNSGRELERFTTANLDFIQHYRPTQNVVRRPVGKSGTGIALTGHHEIMVPLLAAMLRFC
ncbi:MAG TPA: deoxyhypusine synthase family protein [Acidobacteriota bacterium]|nr:deoxyhypusine synthase family protein [Acidobacteriota bacterium]